MSSSTSYREIALTPEEREALAHRNRARRLHEQLLPELAAHAQNRIELATSAGLISAHNGNALTQQLGSATALDAVRAVVTAIPDRSRLPATPNPIPSREPIPAISTEPIPTSGPHLIPTVSIELVRTQGKLPNAIGPYVLSSLGPIDSSASPTTDVAWKMIEARARLTVLVDEAEDLGDVPEIDSNQVFGLLDAAAADAAVGKTGLAESQLRQVETLLDEFEERVDAQLNKAEARLVTMNTMASILETMGFTITARGAAGTPVLEARTDDGRTVGLRLEADGDRDLLVSSATDTGHALPVDHPRSGEICEPAVVTQADLHQLIGRNPTLLGGRISTRVRPVRGLPGTGTARTPSQRSTDVNRPKSQRANP